MDFETSVLERNFLESTRASSLIKRKRVRLFAKLENLLVGRNRIAERFAQEMIERTNRGNILVIGGGTLGSGSVELYKSACTIVGTDIYASEHTVAIVDGHNLPFIDQTFDGVWIQAVLEHVLDPRQVVEEIWRVLKPGGFVFADTPFMQHVHEGAYDFTRFTLSGHRWLFNHFSAIDTGVTSGAGTMLYWSIKYFIGALTGSRKAARLLSAPFFWLRFLDGKTRDHADGASGVYFFGSKSELRMTTQDIIHFYNAFGD